MLTQSWSSSSGSLALNQQQQLLGSRRGGGAFFSNNANKITTTTTTTTTTGFQERAWGGDTSISMISVRSLFTSAPPSEATEEEPLPEVARSTKAARNPKPRNLFEDKKKREFDDTTWAVRTTFDWIWARLDARVLPPRRALVVLFDRCDGVGTVSASGSAASQPTVIGDLDTDNAAANSENNAAPSFLPFEDELYRDDNFNIDEADGDGDAKFMHVPTDAPDATLARLALSRYRRHMCARVEIGHLPYQTAVAESYLRALLRCGAVMSAMESITVHHFEYGLERTPRDLYVEILGQVAALGPDASLEGTTIGDAKERVQKSVEQEGGASVVLALRWWHTFVMHRGFIPDSEAVEHLSTIFRAGNRDDLVSMLEAEVANNSDGRAGADMFDL